MGVGGQRGQNVSGIGRGLGGGGWRGVVGSPPSDNSAGQSLVGRGVEGNVVVFVGGSAAWRTRRREGIRKRNSRRACRIPAPDSCQRDRREATARPGRFHAPPPSPRQSMKGASGASPPQAVPFKLLLFPNGHPSFRSQSHGVRYHLCQSVSQPKVKRFPLDTLLSLFVSVSGSPRYTRWTRGAHKRYGGGRGGTLVVAVGRLPAALHALSPLLR